MKLSDFKPVQGLPSGPDASYGIRLNGTQVYLSAIVNRHLGMPEKVAIFTDDRNKDQSFRVVVVNYENLDEGEEVTPVGVTGRPDSDAGRLTRVPLEFREMMEGMVATDLQMDEEGVVVATMVKGEQGGR